MRKTLAQTEDDIAIQQCKLNQHNFTNEQYSERFNTNVDVGESIGITIQHRVLM